MYTLLTLHALTQVFSDNDKLSALVAAGADADGLALLTDVDAVYTKPPDQVISCPSPRAPEPPSACLACVAAC